MLIPGVLLKSFLRTLQGSHSVTSSPESADGPMPCTSQESPLPKNSGPQVSHVSHSASQERSEEPRTSGTLHPCSSNSSGSVALQSALESRLLQNLHGLTGSPEYVWNLKHWDIGSGPPIFALRALARSEKDGLCVAIRSLGSASSSDTPTSDNGFTGSQIDGWPTPSATKNTKNSADPQKLKEGGVQTSLADAAWLCRPMTGWPTPIASANCETHDAAMKEPDRAENRSDGGCSKLAVMAHIPISGYPTAAARDWKDGEAPSVSKSGRMDKLTHMVHTFSSPAETARPAALNPRFSGWLQGFPAAWCQAAIKAHRKAPTKKKGTK